MNLEDFIIGLIIFLFFLILFMMAFAALWFKRNEKKYNSILDEFNGNGFDLDSVTRFSTGFGVLLVYQKIIYFVRLHKGVKMYHAKNKLVQKEAYEFIQCLPEDRIDWILKLHKFYRCIYTLIAIFFAILIFFVNYY